ECRDMSEDDIEVTPSVSVVMPFRDALPFFAEAIESVLAQTYPALELVLVDDASSDGSSDVAERYVASSTAAVSLLRHPGGVWRGMSASRNLGISASHGDLIAFLDADDVWMPDHLELDVALLTAHPDAGF